MGSAFLVAKPGLKGELQHANYIDHWLKMLKEDASAIVRAASMAQKAFEFIYAFLDAEAAT
jgi:antirestriction protein ArdC